MLLVRPQFLRLNSFVLFGLKWLAIVLLVQHQLRQLLGRHFSCLVAALVVDAATALVALHLRHTLGQRSAGSGHTSVRAVANVAAAQRLRHNAQRVAIDVNLWCKLVSG